MVLTTNSAKYDSFQWGKLMETIKYMMSFTQLVRDMKKMKSEHEFMSGLLTKQEVTTARKYVSLWLNGLHNKREERTDKKNLEISTFLKLSGNKEFQLKKYTTSIQLYTKSALYAPSDSKELPIAIANRSAALFYLERWQDCIEDIKLAIKLGHPENLRYKLHLRAAQCYFKLGKRRSTAEILLQLHDMMNHHDIPNEKKERLQEQINEITSRISDMEDHVEDIDTTESLLPEISFGENPNFRFASAAIEIKYTPRKGRYVVANRNISRGQVLFVEKSFAFVSLNNDIDNICHNCCSSYDDTPVPCPGCVDTLFCNINCREEACSTYHHWECPGQQMGLWSQIGIAHLALKTFFMCVTTTDNERFNEVQELVTNFRKYAPIDVVSYGITAFMLTLYLSKYTDFFQVVNLKECLVSKFSNNNLNINCELLTEHDEQVYVSSLLLRHILQLISNGHAITKINTIADKDTLLIQQQDRIATAIYPSASMMNHSCDPNIINSFMDDVVIVKAARDIEAGEEIFHCYGPDFRRMSNEERKERLESQYCFKCSCKPCTMPEYENFTKKFNAMKCPGCSEPLYDTSTHCPDCGTMLNEMNYVLILKQSRADFDEAEIYIQDERYKEALVKLKECLFLRRSVLYKYHEDITVTLDYIARIYAIMEQWLNSIVYLEHCLVAIKEKYGPSSLEVCNEINKLTDICLKYLQGESNTASKFYKNVLKKTRRYLNHAQEIVEVNYGPWNDIYSEIATKKDILSSILQNFNL